MTAEEGRAGLKGCCGTVHAADDSSRVKKTGMGTCTDNNNNNNSNNHNLQAFQLIALARYLLGVPIPSPVSNMH